MDLGARLAGFEGVYGADSDPVAVETYRANLGREVEVADLSDCPVPSGIKGVDLLLGGPPCQGFSSAGPKQDSDPRNKLWRHYLDYVLAWKPKVFILENVPGFMKEFSGFAKAVEGELKGEYNLECKRLVAQFYGTPQFRDRVILQGIRRDLAKYALWPGPTSEEFYHYTRTFGTAISMAEALQDLGPSGPYNNGASSDHSFVPLNPGDASIAKHIPNGGSLKNIPDRYLPAPYIGRERTDSGWTWYYRKPRPDLPGRGVIASIRPIYATILVPDVMHRKTRKGWVWDPIDPVDHTNKNGLYTSPVSPRRLTVRECARLQTFPDWFRFAGTPLQQHRQIGNAVPVELARRLCESAANLILSGGASVVPAAQFELF